LKEAQGFNPEIVSRKIGDPGIDEENMRRSMFHVKHQGNFGLRIAELFSKQILFTHIAVQINSNARRVRLISLGFWNDIRPF